MAPGLSPRERTLTLAGVLTALMLAALDQTVVATAGPAIQRDLAIPAALYAWLTTAYLVAATVMLPIYGKLSDIHGRKPILLIAVGLFLAGSFLCSIAPSTLPLIAARGVQGLGAAGLITTTFAVIGDLYPPAVRGKYMGLISAVFGVSSVVGPLAGGLITDHLGWHWVFFINLPLGAGVLWIIARWMPTLGGRAKADRPRLDVAGAAWLLGALVPLLVALSLMGAPEGPVPAQSPGPSPVVMALFAAAGIGAVGFTAAERRAPDPILDLHLFRDRTIGLGSLASFVLGTVFLISMVFLPLYLVNVLGVSATSAGLAITPLMLGIVAGSLVSGNLVTRLGRYKTLLLGSLVLLALSFAIMGFTLMPDSTATEVTLKMVLVGLGVGPSYPIYTLAMQNAARPSELGVVTGMTTFARSLGQVVGVTAFGLVFAATLGEAGIGSPGIERLLTEAVSLLYRVGLVVVVLGIAITAVMPELPLRKDHGLHESASP